LIELRIAQSINPELQSRLIIRNTVAMYLQHFPVRRQELTLLIVLTRETLMDGKAINGRNRIRWSIAKVSIGRTPEIQHRIFGDDRIPGFVVDIGMLL
jgi:hypothetical protein